MEGNEQWLNFAREGKVGAVGRLGRPADKRELAKETETEAAPPVRPTRRKLLFDSIWALGEENAEAWLGWSVTLCVLFGRTDIVC